MKRTLDNLSKDYERVAAAILFLESHCDEQPELDEVALHVGLSSSHFQRLFSRWAGISPKRFLQYLTLKHTRQVLRESDQSLLDTTHDAGLSSVSRLHDLYLSCEAVSPAQYRAAGRGLTIQYGFHPTPFGSCLIGVTAQGLCWFQFVSGQECDSILTMKLNWKHANFLHNQQVTQSICESIFAPVDRLDEPLHTVIKGTPFQLKVWEALLKIPAGRMVSYHAVARGIGHPNSSRAVANAIANNPLHYLIPCHRVIRQSGDLGGYRGGPLRKKAILGWEAARISTDEQTST